MKSDEVQRDEKVLLHLTGGGMSELERDLGDYGYARSLTIDLNDPASALFEIKAYLEKVPSVVRAPGNI